MKKTLIFLVGPTGVGKTELAVLLAKRIGAEIISCDSMQVYRSMDIGTSKPSAEIRSEVVHHLIDILEPTRTFSAADFREKALELIPQIHNRGRIPLIVGGAGLYVVALVDGLFPSPASDWNLRQRFQEEAKIYGQQFLYERLKDIDPKSASQLHPHDLRRIIRALEVYERTKIPLSKLKEETRGISHDYQLRIFGLNRPREELYRRIEQRIESMFKDGLIEEVRRLMETKVSLSAAQALGYKEITGYLRGEYSQEEAKALLKKNTHQFVRRQLSWFRRDKRIEWIEIIEGEDAEVVTNKIMERLSNGTGDTCDHRFWGKRFLGA
jgi:tRNA dimethylallyltransferase